ncbi:hypothetical protein TKK_0013203 [Trichogramma kaykai]
MYEYDDYSSDSSDTTDYERDESDAEGDDPATCRENLEKLKSLMQDKQIDCQAKKERREFHRQLHRSVRRWRNLLPDLRDIFRPEEIDWLLSEDMHRGRHAFIDFAIRTGYEDEPEVDENGETSSTRLTTALHHAARDQDGEAISKLFKIYSRFDVNYRDESGFTHFHAACAYGCDDVVEKFLESGQDPDCLIPRESDEEGSVDPPLFLAIARGHKRTMELLLRGGADPKLADKNGWTALHMICGRKHDDGMAELFFEINDEKQKQVDVEAQSRWGDRPLQLALENKHEKVTELLLRRGAEPSLVERNGSNCVHLICARGPDDEVATFLKRFFEIVEKVDRSVEVDARDELGRTPLQRAVERDNAKVVEVLLRGGADPNLTDAEGLTLLHSLCTKGSGDRLAELLFEIGEEKNLGVQVDASDKKGRTPLQWAVANFLPDLVDVLLKHGADVSSFVHPSEEHFDECKWLRTNFSKLKLVLHNLAVVEHLEKRGYEPLRRDALAIMRIFLEDASRDISVSLDDLRSSEQFVSEAKELLMNSSLSLYDFVRLRRKLLPTLADFLSFVNSNGLSRLTGRYGDKCERYLADKMEREFFHRWALDSFVEMVNERRGRRLPIECCDMILDLLENEDLMRVCQAAEIGG